MVILLTHTQHWMGGWLCLALQANKMGWRAFGTHNNAMNRNLPLPLRRKVCSQGKGRPNKGFGNLTPHKIFIES